MIFIYLTVTESDSTLLQISTSDENVRKIIAENEHEYSEEVPRKNVKKVVSKCIQLELVVKNLLELEHLKRDVESGVLLNRHVSWLKEKGGTIPKEEEIEIKLFHNGEIAALYKGKIDMSPLKGKLHLNFLTKLSLYHVINSNTTISLRVLLLFCDYNYLHKKYMLVLIAFRTQ